jgi:hypothetical protein
MAGAAVDVLAVGVLDSPGQFWAIGAALIVAGLSGTRVNMFGLAVPGFKTWPRQIFAIGLGSMGLWWGFQMENFRVTSVSLVEPSSHIGADCPFKLVVKGTVRVAGGKGDVSYVVIYPTVPDETVNEGLLDFNGTHGQSIRDELLLTNKNVGRQGIHDKIQLRIDAPNSKSDVASLAVKCQRSGFATFVAEGYRATYPAGWRIVQKDEVITTYRRSKFESPGGDYFVLIDWGPDARPTPLKLSQDCSLISERRLTLGAHSPTEWVYSCEGKEFVTYRFGEAGDSYGIKAGGFQFGAAQQVARRVVTSIAPR